MLKTLSTKSTKLRKGIHGVGGGRKEYGNRAKLGSKDEIDNGKVKDNEVRKKD